MNHDPQSLAAALGVSGGIICATGAGGKKSLLYALADERGGRIALTSTTFTLMPPQRYRKHLWIEADADLHDALIQTRGAGVFTYGTPSDKRGRMAGVAPHTITAIHRVGGYDLTLVKADGARMRGIKGPRADEPALVPEATRVLPIVSAAVIGQPLNEDTAHRPEILATVIGAALHTPISAAHVATLLASEQGALQGTAGHSVIPVINQVDNDERLQQARAAARGALQQTDRFDRVVLTC